MGFFLCRSPYQKSPSLGVAKYTKYLANEHNRLCKGIIILVIFKRPQFRCFVKFQMIFSCKIKRMFRMITRSGKGQTIETVKMK